MVMVLLVVLSVSQFGRMHSLTFGGVGHSLKHVNSGQNSNWQGLTHMIIPKPITVAEDGMELAGPESYSVF